MSIFINKYARENNIEILDASAPLTLEVKRGDITKALAKNSKCCAYARAAKRLPDVERAYFFRSTAYLEYPDKMVRYRLPPSVQKEIVSFDRAKVMAPGRYQLSIARPSDEIGAVRKRSKKQQQKEKAAGRSPRGTTSIKRGIMHRTQMVRTLQEPPGS